MFGLGWSEILIIGVIGFVLLGPDELPKIFRALSRWIKDLTEARDQFTKTVQDEDLVKEVRQTVDLVNQKVNEVKEKSKDWASEVENDVKSEEEKLEEPK